MKHRFTATILAALSPTVGIAATVAPAYLQSPAPQQSTIRVAEQAQARPGSAGSGGCYVQGQWYRTAQTCRSTRTLVGR